MKPYQMNSKINCILLIDDDEPTNFFTQIILEESGCTDNIKVTQSGREALDYLTKSETSGNDPEYPSPDLIFLDINMPAMNGWEFLEEYKKIETVNKRVIIMLTTSLFPEDRIKAQQMPEVAGFEHKPLTEEKVKEIMSKYFVPVNG
jgi:CheY-like chemotaxis protein